MPNPDGGQPASIKIDGDFRIGIRWSGNTATPPTIQIRATREVFAANRYTNRTGRNDFVMSKVARDRKNLYFHVQTRDALTPPTDPYWMLLYIDADQNRSTGWNGYDFIVNTSVQNGKIQIRRLQDDGQPGDEVGWGAIGFYGNQMELSIPATILGIDLTQPFAFDFHWADNIQRFGKLEEFFVNRDHAPALQNITKPYPMCLGNNENEVFNQKFFVKIDTTRFDLTTVINIRRGNFNGELKVDETITTP